MASEEWYIPEGVKNDRAKITTFKWVFMFLVKHKGEKNASLELEWTSDYTW